MGMMQGIVHLKSGLHKNVSVLPTAPTALQSRVVWVERLPQQEAHQHHIAQICTGTLRTSCEVAICALYRAAHYGQGHV